MSGDRDPLPAPLIPAEVDLRGLEWMPFFGARMLSSEFNARTLDDAAWRAAVNLWWAAWNEVPAGSLPDDDVRLCRAADLGRDIDRWQKARAAGALYGFERCSDGRLYHRAMTEHVLEAWERRKADRDRRSLERARKAAYRASKFGQDSAAPSDNPPMSAGHNGSSRGTNGFVTQDKGESPADFGLTGEDRTGQDRTGQDRTGQDRNKKTKTLASRDASRSPDDSPIVATIPLIDGTDYGVSQAFVDELDIAYPAIDPSATLREIRVWCVANPSHRKTRSGAARFINNWFSREQNRASAAPVNGSSGGRR